MTPEIKIIGSQPVQKESGQPPEPPDPGLAGLGIVEGWLFASKLEEVAGILSEIGLAS